MAALSRTINDRYGAHPCCDLAEQAIREQVQEKRGPLCAESWDLCRSYGRALQGSQAGAGILGAGDSEQRIHAPCLHAAHSNHLRAPLQPHAQAVPIVNFILTSCVQQSHEHTAHELHQRRLLVASASFPSTKPR